MGLGEKIKVFLAYLAVIVPAVFLSVDMLLLCSPESQMPCSISMLVFGAGGIAFVLGLTYMAGKIETNINAEAGQK